MMAVTEQPILLGARPDRYRSNPKYRLSGLAAVLLLHVVFVAALLWQGMGVSNSPGRGDAHSGELAVFELLPADRAPTPPSRGDGDDTSKVLPQTVQVDGQVEVKQIGSTSADAKGATVLGDELAQLLADDPFSGGGRADYEAMLRRHISTHSKAPADSRGRRHTGTVIVRFRIARGGQIVDARVLKSGTAFLDEAALAALWRSEPLPSVPASLDTPLEVDVPIDFRVRI
ncbi:energy transducer TonB family protein [Erythrobacter aureus]|uniref:energy transducer TonB family protein n=1 Tax=Erythrobacter aureus TaxID=2182384 RepID=UPI003A8F1F9C